MKKRKVRYKVSALGVMKRSLEGELTKYASCLTKMQIFHTLIGYLAYIH